MRNTPVLLLSMVLMINVLIIDGHAIPRDINDKKGVSLYKRGDSGSDSDQDPGPSQNPVTEKPDPDLLQDFLHLTVPVQVGATGQDSVVDAYMKKLLGSDLSGDSERDSRLLKSGTEKLIEILKAKPEQDRSYQQVLEDANYLLDQFVPGSTPTPSSLEPTQIHSYLKKFAFYLVERHREKQKLFVEVSLPGTDHTRPVNSAVEARFYKAVEFQMGFLDHHKEKLQQSQQVHSQERNTGRQQNTGQPGCGCLIM